MTLVRRQAPPHRYIGQDPTVPHLKYGLFQNPKKPYVSRGIIKPTIRTSDINESISKRRDSKKQRNLQNKLESTKQESMKTKTNEQICWRDVRAIQNGQAKLKEEEFSRNIYSRNNQVQPQAATLTDSTKGKPSRHLAVSASTHLDIKPRLHSVSQSLKKYS